jgi:hypothetical protein
VRALRSGWILAGLVLLAASPASAAEQSVRCGLGAFGAGAWPPACWRPYSDGSFFNRPLPARARLIGGSRAASDAMVRRILAMGPIPELPVNPDDGGPQPGDGGDYFHPLYHAQILDPVYRVRCIKYGGDCEISGMRFRIPARALPASGSDDHMTVIDQASGWEYDLWGVQTVPLPPQGGEVVVDYGGRTRIDGPGGGDADSDSDANAAHTGNAGGIIRFEELTAGRIDHALFLMVGCTAERSVFPARGLGGTCESDVADAPPVGQWLRLDMSDAEIEALGMPAWKTAILRAFARYGGMVGDTGGNEAFGLQLESPMTYRSFGFTDPWIPWALAQDVFGDAHVRSRTNDDGELAYALDVAAGVDWKAHLRAIDPCVIERTC